MEISTYSPTREKSALTICLGFKSESLVIPSGTALPLIYCITELTLEQYKNCMAIMMLKPLISSAGTTQEQPARETESKKLWRVIKVALSSATVTFVRLLNTL
jgi:hypothetical protein